MTRPCFLIIDREYPASISTRKLVVESAKFNVITAYSPAEAVDTLRRFAAVDGVVLDAESEGISCEKLIQQLHEVREDVPVVTVAPGGQVLCPGARYSVDSHDPKRLIETLQRLCPAGTQQVSREDDERRTEESYWRHGKTQTGEPS
jgi:DNA-binding NtrC family response regulator